MRGVHFVVPEAGNVGGIFERSIRRNSIINVYVSRREENTLLSYRSHSKPSVEHVTALSAQGPFAISHIRRVLQSDLQIPT